MNVPPDANIGLRGRRVRRWFGIVVVALSLGAWVMMEWAGANRWWRLAVLPVLWGGLISLLEARAHTCVVHAVRGTCEVEQRRAFEAPGAVAANRARAKRIYVQATALAFAAAVVLLLVP